MPASRFGFNRVVIYYQTQIHNNKYFSPIPLIPVATHLIIAAFHLMDGEKKDDPKILHVNNVPPEHPSLAQMWTDVGYMQENRVKVMGMLGGWEDQSYARLHDNFDAFYKPLKDCITTYGLDGIDLDVEDSPDETPITGRIDDIVKLIQQLRSDFGIGFIITLAPVAKALSDDDGDNISGFSYTDLEANCGGDIDWYNAQFYSGYGSMGNASDYLDKLENFPLDPRRLVAGTLSNGANGTGWVELDNIKSTMRDLLATYPDSFGGIAAWEYYNSNPDTDEPWTWAAVMNLAMVNWREVLTAARYSNLD